MATKEEVLSYAKTVQRDNPEISEAELRDHLFTHFASLAAPGAVNNPADWLRALPKIARGLKELIEGVMIILRKE